jgi:hypothetical protein
MGLAAQPTSDRRCNDAVAWLRRNAAGVDAILAFAKNDPVMQSIEIIDETTYTFGSSDNLRRYPFECDLSAGDRPSSVHGVIIDGLPAAVFGACGGTTRPHPGSLLKQGGRYYLAVGSFVVCFSASPFEHHWSLAVDPATCFGVYCCVDSGALIAHGELEISRFTDAGNIVWSASGADIFSEGFALRAGIAEAVDFNGKVYRFDLSDGRLRG